MAVKYYGWSRNDLLVTESGSTTSKNIELAVDQAAIYTREEVLLAIDRIHRAVQDADGTVNN